MHVCLPLGHCLAGRILSCHCYLCVCALISVNGSVCFRQVFAELAELKAASVV